MGCAKISFKIYPILLDWVNPIPVFFASWNFLVLFMMVYAMFIVCIWVYRNLASSPYSRRYSTCLKIVSFGIWGSQCIYFVSCSRSINWLGDIFHMWKLGILSALKGYQKIGQLSCFSWKLCNLTQLLRRVSGSVTVLLLAFHEIFVDFCRTGIWFHLEHGGLELRGWQGFLDALYAQKDCLKVVQNKWGWPLGQGSHVGYLQYWSGLKLHWILSCCGGDVGCHRLGRLWF